MAIINSQTSYSFNLNPFLHLKLTIVQARPCFMKDPGDKSKRESYSHTNTAATARS